MWTSTSPRSAFDRSSTLFFAALTVILGLFFLALYPRGAQIKSFLGFNDDPFAFPPPLPIIDDSNHPIEQLVQTADEEHARLVESETFSIFDAAKAYRERRGRHPPPGFETWYNFAKKHNASIIEPFFDQIYQDLEPFWSIKPQELRDFVKTWNKGLSVRNTTVNIITPYPDLWLGFWQQMLYHMPKLPDVDMAFVTGDNPRVLTPFTAMVDHMRESERSRIEHNQIPIKQIRHEFWQYPPINGTNPEEEPYEDMKAFASAQDFWDTIVDACRPDDPVRQHSKEVPKNSVPPIHSTRYTVGSTKGYVSNATTARNVCHNPNMRTLHGYLIDPNGQKMFTYLRPIFAVTKMVGVGNDILVPPPTHWLEKGTYAGPEHTTPWSAKKDAAVWRGVATGGHHTADNWFGFHRHRMMHTMNGTLQSSIERELAQSGLKTPSIQQLQATNPETFDQGTHNFPFPLRHLYGLAAQSYGKLGEWMSSLTNAGFTDHSCSPKDYFLGRKNCTHTDPYYSIVNTINITEMMQYKYLPDVDGHTSSGRFLGFVRSLSLPIKSSIFAEWHDRRLVPWRHFVPMSAEYQEWWGLMQYFVGYKAQTDSEVTVPGHDAIAEKIARQGNEWSHHVERREHLLIYFYRLILEYTRICADNRVELGYVEDLLAELDNAQ